MCPIIRQANINARAKVGSQSKKQPFSCKTADAINSKNNVAV